jgi:hypothetical protein
MPFESFESKTILIHPTHDKVVVWDYQDQNFKGHATEAILPGQCIQLVDDTLGIGWELNDSTTEIHDMAIALPRDMLNQDDLTAYAVGDMVKALWVPVGARFRGLVVSGTDLTNRAVRLAMIVAGKFGVGTTTAAANVAFFVTLESGGGVLGVDTLITMVRTQ